MASPPPAHARPIPARRPRFRPVGPARASAVGLVVALVVATTLVTTAAPAHATWSLVAVEPGTDRVGAAIASCVPAELVGDPARPLAPVALVPGVGAAISQARFDATAPGRLAQALTTGERPAAAVARLVAEEPEDLAAVRQHAAVILAGDDGTPEAAAHTGVDNVAVALDRTDEVVSVQGNLLVSATVVEDALAAFTARSEVGDDLGSALVAALVAGSEAGGDSRCGDQTALFAQVAVAEPGDDPSRPSTLLTVVVAQDDGTNPVAELDRAWSQGRRGLVDLAEPESGSGGVVRIIVLVAAVAMVAGAALALRRGLGSISARR